MIRQSLFFMARGLIRIISNWLWFLVRVLISVSIRAAPHVFRLMVSITFWVMRLLNQSLNGLLSTSLSFVLLASTAFWPIFLFFLQTIIRLNFHLQPPAVFNPYLVAIAICNRFGMRGSGLQASSLGDYQAGIGASIR